MKDKCRICGRKETELPADMPLGFWICSRECAAIAAQHPENDPMVEILPDENAQLNTSNYQVTWPGEVNAEGIQKRYEVFVDRENGMYVCPCGQPPHPEFSRRGPVAAYLRGIDPITTACHHIGAVLMLERGLSQQLKTPV